jgi:hypothetical protein
MRSSPGIWIVFVVLGVAMSMSMSSAGAMSHPFVRLATALGFMIWCGYVIWLPKRN